MTGSVLNKKKTQQVCFLTLNLLTTTIVVPPSKASKWQMGFNSAFKGLTEKKLDDTAA
jgi:predicted amidophosphoribosyltransferase